MPVLDSTPNELNTCSNERPYGCANRVIKDGYYAPDRAYLPDGSFLSVFKFIKHSMSKDCRFDRSLTDPRCGNGHSVAWITSRQRIP